jgi:protein TonB
METNKILSANLLDILFDGRNKEYGAYELRKTYPKQITKALLVTGTISLLIFGSLLARSPKSENNNRVVLKSYDLASIKDDEPQTPKPKEPEVHQQVRTERLTQIEIKPDDKVTQPPPTQDDLKIADIGLEKQEGIDPNGISRPNDIDNSKGVIEDKRDDDLNAIWTGPIEIEAKFTGNWKVFLERNLNANIPADNAAPAGNYLIDVQFVVDTNGIVSDIKPLTNLGYGMEQEAVRVLKKATKWEPAIQNGRKVKAYRRQRIIFQVLGDE